MRRFHYRRSMQEPLYEYEPWTITEEEFSVENNHHNETIFAVGNGYMGTRATLEEDYSGPEDTTTPGIYINGVYGSEEIIYGEEAPNQPKMSQTILNIANWLCINLFLEQEKFDMLTGEVSDYSRVLDLKKGILVRKLIWKSPRGKKIRLKITRLLSFINQHTGIINYKLQPLNFSGNIKLISAIDGDVQNHHHLRNKKALEVIDKKAGANNFLLQLAPSTDIYVGTVMKNILSAPRSTTFQKRNYLDEEKVINSFEIDVNKKDNYTLTKYVNVYTSRDIAREQVVNRALKSVKEAENRGYEKMCRQQQEFLEEYWDNVDVKIRGDVALQQGFRFNAFHLLQATGRDGLTNIPAKGLTGEFYEGHYFWDTEAYIVPYFLYNEPQIAKELLIYRYNILDKARANARRVRLNGALFPWRTINGDEASGFFMGSTVQYHIDADVAYAVYKYVKATDDYDFLYSVGAEILFETARMWADRGFYIETKGNKFCLNEVCGPDEYKPGVSNNCYTNHMAKFNLEYALEVVYEMKEEAPEKFHELQQKLDLKEYEFVEWEKAAREMYLPYNEELQVHPQDDSFIDKDPIDVDDIPEEELPLVDHWHPLTIWRYQVIKQADVILLMLFLGDQFTLEDKKNNFDYYEPKTTHDSSLSPAIYSIIASEIGYFNEAYNYFMQTARLDLDDYNNNAYKGVHTACMGSTWMALVQGFAGMRNYEGTLHFNPYLPKKWDGYQFKIWFKNCQLELEVSEKGATYRLIEGDELKIKHRDQEVLLQKDIEQTLNLRESFMLSLQKSALEQLEEKSD
ncbi:MAG: glycoside hydrolase family 65 protein [Halanaerobiaceae bacterium]